jgi:hypothetical protein
MKGKNLSSILEKGIEGAKIQILFANLQENQKYARVKTVTLFLCDFSEPSAYAYSSVMQSWR